ncbi:hypothetical protein [Ralstonia solanacearum species complex bacterium KE056]|uniref:hypothetical protein n=1 Tax=Ralstonia solanacearum species complex bacterium KE056 TaxID=3119585 RepID=UPI003C6E4D53
MKALIYEGPGKILLADKPKPELQAPSDAVVRVTLTTICGTDLHIIKGDVPTCDLLSLAPTGSVSLAFGGNCSSGIEPAFDWAYQRRVRIQHGPPRRYRIENHAYRCFRAIHGEHSALPDYFVTASQVDGSDHLRMVAALQPFIDASISKTILVRGGVSPAEVGALLFRAWQLRLKGITIFRPDPASDDVLSVLPAAAGRPACFC